MNILLVSNGDMCRTRMAQELLSSFGRGMRIGTAGITEGSQIPDTVYDFMSDKGYEISRKKPVSLSSINFQEWEYVVALSQEAADELNFLNVSTPYRSDLVFDDILSDANLDELEQKQSLTALYDDMYNKLYEFYRDKLSELIMPRCTCGANTYCRCE